MEEQMMNEENERIMKFAMAQQEREEDRMTEKKKKEEMMSAVQQNVRLKCYTILTSHWRFLLERISFDREKFL